LVAGKAGAVVRGYLTKGNAGIQGIKVEPENQEARNIRHDEARVNGSRP
jgi:hypothetical protein